jgi:hypothetical protein
MKFLILILLVFLLSCNPDFDHPHYKRKSLSGWHRKPVSVFKQGTYRNPVVKKEARQKLIRPTNINLDKW